MMLLKAKIEERKKKKDDEEKASPSDR